MIHLVTGRKGEAHISANDIRLQNRAVYGRELKRLKDGENNSSIQLSSTQIIIKAGSYMWFGMHINITEDYGIIVNYSGSQNWRVLFNYTKTASGDDYVEAVTITADNSTAEPDGFINDDTTQASIIIATFETLDGILQSSIDYNCDVVPALVDYEETTDGRLSSAETAITNHSGRLTTAETKITTLQTQTAANTTEINNMKPSVTATAAQVALNTPQIAANRQAIYNEGKKWDVLFEATSTSNTWAIGETKWDSSLHFSRYKKILLILTDGRICEIPILEATNDEYVATGVIYQNTPVIYSKIVGSTSSSSANRSFRVSATGFGRYKYQSGIGYLYGFGFVDISFTETLQRSVGGATSDIGIEFSAAYHCHINTSVNPPTWDYEEHLTNADSTVEIRKIYGIDPLLNAAP